MTRKSLSLSLSHSHSRSLFVGKIFLNPRPFVKAFHFSYENNSLFLRKAFQLEPLVGVCARSHARARKSHLKTLRYHPRHGASAIVKYEGALDLSSVAATLWNLDGIESGFLCVCVWAADAVISSAPFGLIIMPFGGGEREFLRE